MMLNIYFGDASFCICNCGLHSKCLDETCEMLAARVPLKMHLSAAVEYTETV